MAESADDPLAVFTARWIVPVEGPPLEHGRLTVRGGRIVAIEPHRPNRDSAGDVVVDLGDSIVCPGFVNAHTHLEFGDLTRPLGRPGMSFPDWVREVLAYRRTAAFDPIAATHSGLRESIRCGVTTLGDIASSAPPALFETAAAAASPPAVDVTAFVELIGLGEARQESQRTRLDEFLARSGGEFVRRGISPHAPYSVRPSLVAAAAARSAVERVPLAMHLAESREELQLLRDGTGPFAGLLCEIGSWDPAAIPAGSSPLDYLKTLSRADRALVIHGNYLDEREIEFLAAHAERMTVVYCPRTHAYFEHEEHPLPKLLSAGAGVALGTDGRCTNPDLDLLAEMRTVAHVFPQLARERILRLGTIDGARALGRDREVGSLAVGKQADFVAVAAPTDDTDPFAAALAGESRIVGVWKRGVRVD